MEIAVLTTKGQLLIPKRLRTKYGIKSGGKVIFEETDKGVLITPINEQYFKSFAGILKGGKGIATSLGILIAVVPLCAVISLSGFTIVFFFSAFGFLAMLARVESASGTDAGRRRT